MVTVLVKHNLGQVSAHNAKWLRDRGQQLVRDISKAELRREKAIRGLDTKYFTTVDRRLIKSTRA